MPTYRLMFRAVIAAALVAAASALLALGPTSSGDAATRRTHHYITNLQGSTRPAGLGYDVFDVGASRAAVDALPPGVRGMVWLGHECPTVADAAFRQIVSGLADDPKVFGYFLSDEPHIRTCPRGPHALATRADFIRKVTGGRQKSFVSLSQSSRDMSAGFDDPHAFRPAVTHLDLIGIDPYPCSINGCDFGLIGRKVRLARRSGVPLGAIVPVYQAFGQGTNTRDNFYRMPTAAQERALLAAWRNAVPHPVLDFTYGWGHQYASNPTLVDRPRVQAVLAHFFGR